MALSSFLMKAGICAAFALSCATSVFSQVHFHSNAGEDAIAGHRPGTQVYPDAAINGSGGFLVWEDNVSQSPGLGISALGLDSSLAANGRAFRINQNITGDAQRPRVALLKDGGAVFVWQAGRQGFQQVYARFLSSSNVWLTGDVLVNSFSRDFRINPSATVLENGNVLVVWAGYNELSSSSMQDVYAQLFSPTGDKMGGNFMVNQFSAYNQRTPSAAALHSGGFIVTWVSELQRSGVVDDPDPNHAYSTNLPSVEIYGRFFAADGTGVANEFLINTTTEVVANPSVAVAADDSFLVAWSQKNVRVRTNSWDVFARQFSNTVGGPARMLNAYVYGDQFAPQVKAQGADYFVVWSSMGQDGSWEGVYGRYLGADGSLTSDEFRVNTTTASRQMHPALASDNSGRFLVVWSGFVGGLNAFDLFAQQYQSDSYVPAASIPFTYNAPPDSGSNNVPPADSDGSTANPTGNGIILALPDNPPIGIPAANGFVMAKGTYHGLFYEQDGVSAASAGYINAKTTENGAYSVKLNLGSRNFAIAGRFNAQGLATNTVARPGATPVQIELQLDLSGGDQLIGRVTDGHWDASLLANRIIYSKASPSPQSGNYTLMVAGDPSRSSSSPGGCSFGTVKVDASGSVLLSATLADGTKVSQSSAISKQGFWPLYASLSGGKGLAISWVKFASDSQSDLSGQLVWLKPAAATKYYPGGFTNTLAMSGSAYHAPTAGTRVLNLSQGTVVLSGGGLSQPVTNTFTLGLNNKIGSTSGKSLTVTVTPATGLFKGTMLNSASGKLVPIQGALSRKANVGMGYFLGDATSGEVYVGGAQ